MATLIRIYKDGALTTLKTTMDGIAGATVTEQDYIGSPDVGLIHRRKTLPGTNQLQLALVDNDTGDVVALTNFKFALSEAGLATATAGAPLNLGTQILSGVANALPVWIEYTDASGTVAEYPGAVSLTILDVEDAPA